MEWLIGGFVVWIIYRFLTRSTRRHKYFMQAITWKTGGILGTGARDIHQAVSLFNKASGLGHAQASFELGEIYEDGWSHPTSSNPRDQIAPNEELSRIFFEKCRTQSPDVYIQLNNERRKMQEDVEAHFRSIMANDSKNL